MLALRSNIGKNSETDLTASGLQTTHTVNKPTDAVEGDFIFACLGIDDGASGALPSAPDGTWTLIEDIYATVSSGQVASVWYKEAGSSEPSSYSFTTSFAHSWSSVCFALYDQDDSAFSIYNASTAEEAAGDSTHTSPSITTTDNTDWVVSVFVQDGTSPSDGSWATSSPAALVLLDQQWSGNNQYVGIGVFYEVRNTAGAGSHVVTQSSGGGPTRGSAIVAFAIENPVAVKQTFYMSRRRVVTR